MYADECPHCLESSINSFLQTGYVMSNAEAFNELISDISNGVYESVPGKLFNIYNNNLQKGIRGIFNPAAGDRRHMDYLYKFDANAARFAAYKAHYVENTLFKALEKNPEAFEKNAKAILKAFNRFQVTEYNTLVARCRTTKQLLSFNETKDVYPNLEWIMTRSADPREQHLALVGIIRPIDDPLWQENQPGNLYNCKCDWRQTDKPPTYRPESVPPAKGLDGNPVTTREIFTDKHPYIAKATDVKEVEGFVEKQVFRQFETVKEFENGGKYLVHPLVDKQAGDFDGLKAIARHFAKQGETAYIMPRMNAKSILHRYYFTKNVYKNVCPDLLIGKSFYEYESFKLPYSKRSLSNMLNHAALQSDKIILDIRNATDTVHYIKNRIMGMTNFEERFKEVWVLRQGNVLERIL